jgi:hypothetical protein
MLRAQLFVVKEVRRTQRVNGQKRLLMREMQQENQTNIRLIM